MRAIKLCTAVALSLAVLLALGCGVDAADIRAELDGKHFVSVGKFPLGSVTTAAPAQVAMGHYDLWFTGEEVSWLMDDLCPTSPYEIDGDGNIESTDYFGNPVTGKYERDSGRLQWNGVWYVAE